MKVEQIFSSGVKGRSPEKKYPHYCSNCGAIYTPENMADTRVKCDGCGEVFYFNPYPAVCVLVEHEGKFLLGKRHDKSFEGGKWSLPSGYLELNEDFLTGGKREVREETGLDVQIVSIISVVTNYFRDRQTLVIVLLANVKQTARLKNNDGEMTDLQWFSPTEPFPDMAFAADTHIIKRYFATQLKGIPVDGEYSV
jgi:8-oxo-dGTP diphosphatase